VLPLGLPFRLPVDTWRPYVMEEVVKGEALPLLVEIGNMDYAVEWRLSQRANLALVAEAAERAGLGDANRELNNRLGRMAAQSLKGEITALDVGAGTGDTSAFFLYHLGKMGEVKGLRLVVSDLSVDDLEEEAIKGRALELAEEGKEEVRAFLRDVEIEKVVFNFNEERSLGMGPFDVILANASLHHTSSALIVLGKLRDMLKEGGRMAIGEWTHALHSSIGMVEAALRVLRGVVEGRAEHALNLSGPEGRILAFWKEVAALARERGEVSPIWYFEGHLSSEGWESLFREVNMGIEIKDSFNGGLNTLWILKGTGPSLKAFFSSAWMGEHP